MARKSKTKSTSTKAEEGSSKTAEEATPVTTDASSAHICRVHFNDALGKPCSENAAVTIMSRFGVGFNLSSECPVGTLVRLEFPLPPEFRPFDQDAELFDAVALVQHSSQTADESQSVYHISAMFVAREFPASYISNPQQAYRLSTANADGTWTVTECSSSHKQRRYPRFRIELSVELGLIQKRERTVVKESTFTRDVGSSGVSVITTLRAAAGDKVKFACADLNFYTIATVVNRRNFFGIRDVLHLKFIDERFPVERLFFSKAAGSIEMTPAKLSIAGVPRPAGWKG